jgi:hypothetical protein
MKRYVIVPPGMTASLSTAVGLMGGTMLFESEDDAQEALKFLGLSNPEQHVISIIEIANP